MSSKYVGVRAGGATAPLLYSYKKHFELLLLLLPGLAAMIVFKYLPMYGVLIAFKDFRMLDGILASPWVGFSHFQTLFTGKDFSLVMRNTLTISLLKLVFGFPAPVIFALLLNEIRSTPYKRLAQTFSYLPYFFSWVVLGGIISMLFSTRGPVNSLLKMLGANAVPFFANGGWFLFIIIVTSIWQSLGWNAVLYLASLSAIDEALYEAARIDGANRWRQTLHISIPCLAPTIITVLILSMGNVLDAGFDQIYNLYNPTVYHVSDILDTYVLRRMQEMDYSFGTAVGLFKSVVGLVLIVSTNWLARRISGGEQGIW